MAPVAWIGNFMWWLCDALGTAMTLTGLAGLLYMAARGLVQITDKILNEEEYPNDDRPEKDGNTEQPALRGNAQ